MWTRLRIVTNEGSVRVLSGLSGRVRQGPAPTNLEIPETNFLDDYTVKLG